MIDKICYGFEDMPTANELKFAHAIADMLHPNQVIKVCFCGARKQYHPTMKCQRFRPILPVVLITIDQALTKN